MEQKASKKPRPKQVRKVQLSHRDFLSKAQLRKLREAQPDDLRELLDVMVGTGLRASELIALQVRDVDVSRQMLEVRRGKGARQRTVVISQAAAQVFERWIRATDGRKKSVILRNRDGRPMTYSNLYDRVVKMGKMAGMDHLHPHVFRHTFATILYENQKDIKAVKEQLGHGSIATTDIYAKSSTTAKIEQIKVFDQILPAGSWLLKNTREY
jgi:integrase/recombinase XerD